MKLPIVSATRIVKALTSIGFTISANICDLTKSALADLGGAR